jgi:hypothetical protein
MERQKRKAAVDAYRQRKVPTGAFAVRCGGSGQVWVGTAPDLTKIRNRIWFGLKLGTHTNRGMQDAWIAHGGDSFAFELLETVPENEPAHRHARLVKDMAERWRAELGAETA